MGIMLWSGVLLFLLVWIFVLGILVGRGSLPGDIRGVAELKEQIGLLQEMVTREKVEEGEPEEAQAESPKLAFYEKLSTKKDEARGRRSTKPKVRPKKPALREAPLSELASAQARQAPPPAKEEKDSGPEPAGDRAMRPETSTVETKAPKSAVPSGDSKRRAADTGGEPGAGGDDSGMALLSVKAQYTVQVAAMETREAADEMIARLNRKGYPSYYYDVTIRGKTYYRIRCGRFLSRSDAEKHAELLARKEGIKGFVSKLD
jgi:cell division septation protein DedD